jgi:O-antigen ligase
VLHGRTDTWRAAVETWADRPLHGTGSGAFLTGSARYQDGQTIRFAHDLPLELAAELGVAGFLLALALYAATLRTMWLARGHRATWLLGPAAVAFLASNLVDWTWHLAGAGAVWALAVGGLAGARAHPKFQV